MNRITVLEMVVLVFASALLIAVRDLLAAADHFENSIAVASLTLALDPKVLNIFKDEPLVIKSSLLCDDNIEVATDGETSFFALFVSLV